MRRLLLLLLLALLAGAGVFYFFEGHQGFVMLVMGQTSITLNIWFALLLLVAVVALVWLSLWLWRGGVRLTNGLFGNTLLGGANRARRRTSRGLIEFIEGNWKTARRQLLLAAPRAEEPLINYLAAARCASEIGDEKQALQLLHQAESVAPQSALAIALTQARMQLLHNKYEQCAATLQRAREQAPRHPVVLDLLAKVYRALQDWDALEQLLPSLSRYQVISDEALAVLTEELYVNLLRSTVDKELQQNPQNATKQLHQVWQRLSREQQKNTVIFASYVTQLQRVGDDVAAEIVLRKGLHKHWSNAAVLVYGLVQGENLAKQLRTAEGWLQEHPSDAALLLTLGRLSLRNQLWGKARDYFESSLRQEKQAQTYAELARLLANLGEQQLSAECYQQGLLMTAQPLLDLPQPAAKTQAGW